MLQYRGLLGPLAVVLLVGAAILWSPFEPHGAPVGAVATWDDEDWTVFEAKVRQAAERGLDTVPIGTAMAEIGRTFVGTAYVPQTLEVQGPEGLVIDFGGLDCVTFVENAFALARFVRLGGEGLLGDRPTAEAAYAALLTELRYRDGEIDGYPSRLHYFSDWIADNARRGLVVDIGADLGGVVDHEPIDFMTTHTEAYRQLADPANVERVREAEERLSAAGRTYVPQDRIAGVAERIRDGDIIAATSTVAGLDIAHTGLALWVDGTLRLLHAPLVGDSVEISEVSLAERIQRISGQDGIMVARPVTR
ncbi:MAG TPA: N-acetylmuramoyl-L-alanine amidase-like domain-containing protein [Longimicrobiales bacterium]|nr:N-acetylmuramoyl-L-alanine amidase-like domain-containing protein [Longimicrobiales bacterium]